MRRILATAVVTVAVLSLGMGSASASQYVGTTPNVAASGATTTVPDPLCLEARKVTKTPGPCSAELVSGSDVGQPITSTQLKQYGNLTAANGTTVAAAAAAGTVYIRSWWQEMRGLYYINWMERQEGKFLYNGSIAWVANAHGYVGGYHNCDLGYGIGYSVTSTVCASYGQNTSKVDNYDAFKVSLVFKGFPVYMTRTMHYYNYASGAMG